MQPPELCVRCSLRRNFVVLDGVCELLVCSYRSSRCDGFLFVLRNDMEIRSNKSLLLVYATLWSQIIVAYCCCCLNWGRADASGTIFALDGIRYSRV